MRGMKTLRMCCLMLGLCIPYLSSSQDAGNQEMRVVLFGDSMTKGVGIDSSSTFGSILGKKLNKSGLAVSVINAGKQEDRTDMAIARMQQDVIVKRPDAVLIMFGAFDAMVDSGQTKARVPLNVYKKQLIQIISFLKGIDVTPILMTTPPVGMSASMNREPYSSAGPNFLLKIYMEACRKIARDARIPLVDHLQDWTSMEEQGVDLNTLRLEGFNPNPLGHKKMAELILPTLKEELGPKFAKIFAPSDAGYDSYQSPAILKTRSEFLIALGIGKRSSAGVQSSDLIYKRSFDKGNTWTDLDTLIAGGMSFISHPVSVQEASSAKIFIMYQSRPGFTPEDRENLTTGIKGENISKTYIISSEDEGKTWADPVEITKEVKRAKDATLLAGGSSTGVQLTSEKGKSKMILPFCQKANGKWQVYCVYSDNMGKSWKYYDLIPGAEDKQLIDPQLILESKEQLVMSALSMADKMRYLSESTDGGKSWSPFKLDPTFPSQDSKPSCAYKFNSYYNLYVGSHEATKKGLLKLSTDKGKSWSYQQAFFDSEIGKSTFVGTGTTQAGILFELGDQSAVHFAKFPIKWLMVNKSL